MGEQVRVRFVTEHDQFRVTDAPFVLPQKLGRKGLSEVINHLLEPSPEQAVPFDFSINGQLLRTQLKTFLVANRVNLEEVVSIEYMPALSLSDESKTADAPAWIGSLSVLVDQGQQQQKKKKQVSAAVVSIIAGCYDGTCTTSTHSTGGSLSPMSSATPCHADPVRAVKTWQSGGRSFLATASKDMTLKCWSIASNGGQPQILASLIGHFGSVESVDFWGDNSLLLSGDWAGNICGWSLAKALQGGAGQEGEEDEDEEEGRQSSSRRKKTKTGRDSSAPAAKPELRPALTIRAHSQSVSSICVGSSSSSSSSSSSFTMLSASWDHSIKTWDLNTQDCTATVVSNKVVTSLSSSAAASGAVVTAHPDGKCRLWDLRSNTGSDCRVFSCGDAASASASAGQWVSQVAWHPSKSTVFASADYAGVVRLWDTRASTPLGAVEAHDGKALCCAWAGEDNLLSGGSDCKLVSTPLC